MTITRDREDDGPLATRNSHTNSPRVQELLKQQATIYDGLASSYHAARFADQPGHYDLRETEVFLRGFIANVIPTQREGWHALDVACGTGKAAVTIAQTGGRVVALDGSLQMLYHCRTRATEAGVLERMTVINASANFLPYREDTFDLVCSFRFLHLVPVPVYPVLIQEMIRVAKPGGYVVVEVKNRWYGGAVYPAKDLWHASQGKQIFSSYQGLYQLRALVGQLDGVTLHSLVGLMLPKGWWFLDHPKWAHFIRQLARGPCKALSAHLVAVYRKDRAALEHR